MIARFSSLTAGMAVVLSASGALAQEAAVQANAALPAAGVGSTFGMAGTLALGADRLFGYTHSIVKVEDEQPAPIGTVTITNTVDTISLLGKTPFSTGQFGSPYSTPRLGIDFFVIDNLSIGGSLTYVSESGEGETEGAGQSVSADLDSSSGFLISPRVGFGMMFNEAIGIWPRGGITFFTVSTERKDNTGATTSEVSLNGLALTVEVPFILSPADHVAITLGPTLDFPLSGSSEVDPAGPTPSTEIDVKITDIGLNAGLLTWF